MASNREERLRLPKCDSEHNPRDNEHDPQVRATSYPHLPTLTEGEMHTFEGNHNLQKTYYNWAKAYKLLQAFFSKTKQISMSKVCQGLATTAHFVVAMEN